MENTPTYNAIGCEALADLTFIGEGCSLRSLRRSAQADLVMVTRRARRHERDHAL